MQVIDDQGRLFGRVNVIDALAVLLVLAVVVAGFGLLDSLGTSRESTNYYATVDLGAQPLPVAERISTGDAIEASPVGTNGTVTDVFVTGTNGSEASVVVRVRLTGLPGRSTAGNAAAGSDIGILPGSRLRLRSKASVTEGTVTGVDTKGETLPVATTPVAIEAVVPTVVANEVAVGDHVAVAGHRIATVRSVTNYATADPSTRRLVLGVDLRTLEVDGSRFGAETRPTLGSSVAIDTNSYRLSGTIVATDSHDHPGTVTTRNVTVVTDVRPEIADRISVGLVETSGEETTARILAKRIEPINDTPSVAQPESRTATVDLTVEARLRETDDGVQFHGRPVQVGDTVTFDFQTVRVGGTVTELDSGS